MRKFKLIRTYPGSPITIGLEVCQNGDWYQSNFATKNVEHFHKPLNMVENYPDFWEEIFEVNFQILRISDGFNEYYRSANGKLTINLSRFHEDDYFIKNGSLKNGFEILSVKRLSDNTIFCIDDVVKSKSNLHKHLYKVDRIQLVDNGINVFPLSIEPNGYLPFELIDKIENIKPFYTTEDGVDIFAGDTVYYVLSNFSKRIYIPTTDDRNLTEIHYFSSEEKADEYIEFNIPKYSLKYVKEALRAHVGVFEHFKWYTENIKKD